VDNAGVVRTVPVNWGSFFLPFIVAAVKFGPAFFIRHKILNQFPARRASTSQGDSLWNLFVGAALSLPDKNRIV
jgi:hypothetical protein